MVIDVSLKQLDVVSLGTSSGSAKMISAHYSLIRSRTEFRLYKQKSPRIEDSHYTEQRHEKEALSLGSSQRRLL